MLVGWIMHLKIGRFTELAAMFSSWCYFPPPHPHPRDYFLFNITCHSKLSWTLWQPNIWFPPPTHYWEAVCVVGVVPVRSLAPYCSHLRFSSFSQTQASQCLICSCLILRARKYSWQRRLVLSSRFEETCAGCHCTREEVPPWIKSMIKKTC